MEVGFQQARRQSPTKGKWAHDAWRSEPIALAFGVMAVASMVVSCGRIGYDPLAVEATGGGAGSNNDSGLAGRRDAGSGGTGGLGAGNGGAGGTAGTGAGGTMAIDSGSPPPSDAGQSGAGGAGPDAAPDSSSPIDTGPAPTCNDGIKNQDEIAIDCGGACGPCLCSFGYPTVLGNPNRAGVDVWSPTLSADALTMYVSYTASGSTEQIAVTKRATRGDAFGSPSLLPSPLNTFVEGTPELSADGLSLYFFSEGVGGTAADRDIFVATRASTSAQFDMMTALTSINSPRRDDRPWLSADELTIYFASQRSSTTDDLWRATRTARSNAFGTPVAVTELNSTSNDSGIFLTPDGLVAYFSTDRPGGRVGMDIYRAFRSSVSSSFSKPQLVNQLSSDGDDIDPHLTADGQEMFFSSNWNSSNFRIWRSVVTCP